jgi:hypothetical protein
MLDLKQLMLPLRAFILFSYLSKIFLAALVLLSNAANIATMLNLTRMRFQQKNIFCRKQNRVTSMKHPSARSVLDGHLRAVARIKSELAPPRRLPRRHR